MAQQLVPTDFVVPRTLDGDGFRLELLGPEHNERDHAAWLSSIEHIQTTPGFDSPERTWPVEMSLDQNLEDLEMHARHFIERVGFTYSVLDDDEVIGCVYIYPAAQDGFDVDIKSWVRASRAEMDTELRDTVSAWIAEVWPFSRPFYDRR